MMSNKNQEEYKNLTLTEKDSLIEAFEQGKIDSYIYKRDAVIHRDDDNDITHIVFTNGGPIVYLDFDEQPGLIITKDLDTKAHSAIPWAIWLDMRDELEGAL